MNNPINKHKSNTIAKINPAPIARDLPRFSKDRINPPTGLIENILKARNESFNAVLNLSPVVLSLTPHFMHITALGLVSTPQLGQNLFPFLEKQPQDTHIAAFSGTSLPQFRQNIINPLYIEFNKP
jgi:hypothetical protein